MKYIRTKDGIFDEAEHRHTIKNSKVSIMGIFYEFKQADAIEELYDVVVCIRKIDNEHYIVKRKKIFDYWYLDNFVNCDFYGAIWTDKGLIYKAKMKGVLPNGEIDWELL